MTLGHFRETTEESTKTLVDAVVLHNRIIHVWQMVQDTMSVNLFFEFSVSAFILCTSLLGTTLVSLDFGP